MQSLAWWLILLPLLGAAVLLLGGRALNAGGHRIGVAALVLAFLAGSAVFASLLSVPAGARAVHLHLFRWVDAGTFRVDAGLLLDPLSLAFVLLVTFVGTLIHIYSVAYMEHDPDRRRFFAYLNLFVAAMLLLVLADSYLLLFVGWEGVGLASYLLIGFWNQRPDYAAAAKKAFVVNRVGDVGLALAIMLMFSTFGTVSFSGVLGQVDRASQPLLTTMGLLLLLGACGKSAQFPLQSWLGDAMAGPTPVSALIHAATMVTAGVYLIVRSGPIFESAPTAQLVVVVVGAITLLFGAVVGCAKDDIKKALAASTMSQIGYMTLAAGLGPAGAVFAIFHLLTHGFFKAGLFLGAGSVMHAMDDSADMRRFGALAPHLRTTWLTFGAGWLAIIGFPLLSGFWSKDKIIEAAFEGHGWRPWLFGSVTMLAAGITAFYMSRLFFMTFHGRSRWRPQADPHESPRLMTVPMVILALGSVGLGAALGPTGLIGGWLAPVTGRPEAGPTVLPAAAITALTLVLVALGVFLAYRRYLVAAVPAEVPARLSPLTRAARRDLFQDEVNVAAFERPGTHLVDGLVVLERGGIDGAVSGLAAAVTRASGRVRHLQTGMVRSYALTMLAGVLVLGGALLWVGV